MKEALHAGGLFEKKISKNDFFLFFYSLNPHYPKKHDRSSRFLAPKSFFSFFRTGIF